MKEKILQIGIGGGLFAVISILIYSLTNNSGHTGLNLYQICILFFSATLFLSLLLGIPNKQNKYSNTLYLVSIIGLILPVFLHHTESLQFYNYWVKPPIESHTIVKTYDLIIFSIISGSLILSRWLHYKKES